MVSSRGKNQVKFAQHKTLQTFIFSFFCGVILYILMFGIETLDVSNISWIYQNGGDILHSQLGWEWFRQEPWHFLVGRIDSYGYPFGTSIYFTDSIPLLSVVLKAFSGILPKDFQFFGLWELINLVGQLFVGTLIIAEFTRSIGKQLLCGALLVFSPIFIYRTFGHDSLAAQWILLTGILFTLWEYKEKLWRFAWSILFAITLLIHAYLVAMLVPLWLASLVIRYDREKKHFYLIYDVLLVAGILLLFAWLFGLFMLPASQLGQGGFGKFSWNINGFINPHEFSLFMKPLPLKSDLQNEGFSYLGLGILILFPIAIIAYFKKYKNKKNFRICILFSVLSIIYIAFALSNVIYLNDVLLVNIKLTMVESVFFSMFRTSARFIWPVFYFIVLFSLLNVVRLPRWDIPLLVCALILQSVDIYPLYSQKRTIFTGNYQSPLQSEFWQVAAERCEHVVILPAKSAAAIYEPFAILARQSKLTLNWGYFSRGDYLAIYSLGNQTWRDLLLGNVDDSTLYIIWGEDWIEEAKTTLTGKVPLCIVDGYTVAFSENNGMMQSGLELENYCVLP